MNSSPSGAQVSLLGKLIGETPLKLENQPIGKQDYTLTLPKYKPVVRSLEVTPGPVQEQSVTLERLPTVLELRIDPASKNAVLRVEGQLKGFIRDNKATLELDPDKTTLNVEVSAPGYVPFIAAVKLEPSGQTVLNIKLELRETSKSGSPAPLEGTVPRIIPPVAPRPGATAVVPKATPLLVSVPRSEVFALVIGVGSYGSPDIPPLKYAVSDAERFAALLRDPRVGNLPPENVRLLSDRQARRFQLERAFADLSGSLTVGQTLIVYFSGHGSSSGEGDPLLAPWDAEPEALSQTMLPLQSLLERTGAPGGTGAGQVIVILDACYSGLVGSKSVPAKGAKPIGLQTRDPQPTPRVSVLSASGAQEASFESDELKSGFFTAYLLKALQGEADADRDGQVTLEEAFTYTRQKVSAAVKGARAVSQTPQLWGAGSFALAQNPVRVYQGLLAQHSAQLGRLRAAGKLSGPQLDALLDLLERPPSPADLSDYLSGAIDEDRFLKRLRSGAIQGVPIQ